MEKEDIIKYLESFVKKQKSEVNYGTFRPTQRVSLLKDGLSTRANSVWKQSQIVVAYIDGSDNAQLEQLLKGWKELTRGIFDQYLVLEEPKGNWTVYDKNGENKGGISYLKTLDFENNENQVEEMLSSNELINKVRESFTRFVHLVNVHTNDFTNYIADFEKYINPLIQGNFLSIRTYSKSWILMYLTE